MNFLHKLKLLYSGRIELERSKDLNHNISFFKKLKEIFCEFLSFSRVGSHNI